MDSFLLFPLSCIVNLVSCILYRVSCIFDLELYNIFCILYLAFEYLFFLWHSQPIISHLVLQNFINCTLGCLNARFLRIINPNLKYKIDYFSLNIDKKRALNEFEMQLDEFNMTQKISQ